MEMMYKPIDNILNEMILQDCLKNRRIHLTEEVDRESIFKVLYFLRKLENLDSKTGEKLPITIVVDSFGGLCYSCLSLCSKISEMKNNSYEINIEITGVAMSAASIIACVGSKRGMYKYATIMIHSILSGTYGKLQDMREDMEETERLWKILCDIYKENTKITQEQLDDIVKRKHDWFLSAEECLELGIIDYIIG